MMEICPRRRRAGIARASGINRGILLPLRNFADRKAPVGGIQKSVSRLTGWRYTIKRINASPHHFGNVFRCSYAKKVPRLFIRNSRNDKLCDAPHFFLGAPQKSPDAESRERKATNDPA